MTGHPGAALEKTRLTFMPLDELAELIGAQELILRDHHFDGRHAPANRADPSAAQTATGSTHAHQRGVKDHQSRKSTTASTRVAWRQGRIEVVAAVRGVTLKLSRCSRIEAAPADGGACNSRRRECSTSVPLAQKIAAPAHHRAAKPAHSAGHDSRSRRWQGNASTGVATTNRLPAGEADGLHRLPAA